MRNPRKSARKAGIRKVIKLDLASMLHDETLAGHRQLSALQAERAAAAVVIEALDEWAGPASLPSPAALESTGFVLQKGPGTGLMPDPGSKQTMDAALEEALTYSNQITTVKTNPDPVFNQSPVLDHKMDPAPVLTEWKQSPGFVLPLKPKPIRTVQDGLHAGEVDLLQFLWLEGQPMTSDPHVRLISLGNSTIRRQTVPGSRVLGRSTVRRLLRCLADKHCIRLRTLPTVRTPAVYEVFSFSRILENWRALGWDTVYRDRRAVLIAGSNTYPGTVYKMNPGFVYNKDPGFTVNTSPAGPGFKTNPEGGSKLNPPSINNQLKKDLTEPPPLPPGWARWCLEHQLDSAVGRQIWNACLAACPDMTLDEVLYFADQKWAQLQNSKAVSYPGRVLAVSLPGYLTGEVFQEYRLWQIRLKEQHKQDMIELYINALAHPEDYPAETGVEAQLRLVEWGVRSAHDFQTP